MLLTYCFRVLGDKKKESKRIEIRRRQIVMSMCQTLDLPTISEKDESVKALSGKLTMPWMQNKAKENNRPVSFEMCIATSIWLQLGHISRPYYMCDSIRTDALQSQALLSRKS